MLELVLERGQGYDEIATLLDVDTPEVRARARAALTELGGADPDEHVALTDYLLGQADPIGRADAVRHLKNTPESLELAQKLEAQLRVIAPGAELPQLPGAATPAKPAAPKAPPPAEAGEAPTQRMRFWGSLERRQQQLLGILAAFVVLVVAVVLGVSGVFGGDEDQQDQTQAAQEGLTRVDLRPTEEGSDATGVAAFARVQDQPVLQVNAANLQPTSKGQVYVVWLYNSPDQAFPIAREQVGEGGNLSGPAPIPQAVVPLLPQFRFIDISLSEPAAVGKVLQRAGRRGASPIPAYSGTSILRGEIPRSVRTNNPES
jgi:hypothetical protein